jgi:MFS family permease
VDRGHASVVRLGLRENLSQFSLLVVVNAFVGGMVGLERTVVPLIGSQQFGLVLKSAIFSFIISFGVVKACSNLVSGTLADRVGRKKVLVAGWVVGVPVPFMIALAPSWGWIVAANVLLGVNQGLAWSMTVIMKIDLVGPRGRGLAVGLNEFAGYLAVGLSALATGYLASIYGLRPEPFYLGIGYATLGLLISVFLVRDTTEHVRLEMEQHPPESAPLTFREVFSRTSFKDRHLFACSQAGLVNNLNDGMSWGVFPCSSRPSGSGWSASGCSRPSTRRYGGAFRGPDRALERPVGSKGLDRGGDVGAGWGDLPHRGEQELRLVVVGEHPPWPRHGDGVPILDRGRL